MPRSVPFISSRRWGALLGAVLLVVVGLTLGSVLTFTPQQPVRPVVLSTAEWAPFVSDSLPGGGPVAVVVTDVMRRAGYEPDVSFTSWPMTESYVDSGASLALFPVVSSEQRTKKYLASDPIVEFDYVLFHRTDFDGDAVRTADDLAALRVGFVAGYDYWPEIEAAVGEKKVTLEDTSSAFAALAAGEVDLVAEGLSTGTAHLGGTDFHGDATEITFIERSDPLLRATQPLRLMMRRSAAAEELMVQFNTALADYRRAGLHTAALAGIDAPGTSTATIRPVTPGEATVRIADVDHHTPSGTRVSVLAWPSATESRSSRAEVKVLDGPLAGRTARVRVVDLELDSASASRTPQ